MSKAIQAALGVAVSCLLAACSGTNSELQQPCESSLKAVAKLTVEAENLKANPSAYSKMTWSQLSEQQSQGLKVIADTYQNAADELPLGPEKAAFQDAADALDQYSVVYKVSSDSTSAAITASRERASPKLAAVDEICVAYIKPNPSDYLN